jgi:hypothetical protein
VGRRRESIELSLFPEEKFQSRDRQCAGQHIEVSAPYGERPDSVLLIESVKEFFGTG